MIVAGYIASTICDSQRWVFFGFSMLCAAPVIHFHWTAWERVNNIKLHCIQRFSATVWGLHALVWLLSSGTGTICIQQENLSYVVLDILAKFSWSMVVKAAVAKQEKAKRVRRETEIR